MNQKPSSERPRINEVKQWQLVNVDILSAESGAEPIRLWTSWNSDMAVRGLQLTVKPPHFRLVLASSFSVASLFVSIILKYG